LAFLTFFETFSYSWAQKMYLRTILFLFSAKLFTGEVFYMGGLIVVPPCEDTDHDSDTLTSDAPPAAPRLDSAWGTVFGPLFLRKLPD
jgi:hypothetical protein